MDHLLAILYMVIVGITLLVLSYKFFYRHTQDDGESVLFTLLLTAMPIFGITLLSSLIFFVPQRENCKSVVEIGGCNRSSCGVRLSDGSTYNMSAPVLGEEVCNLRFRWKK